MRNWNQLLEELRDIQFALLAEQSPAERVFLKELEQFVFEDLERIAQASDGLRLGKIGHMLREQIQELKERSSCICDVFIPDQTD